jgi:hypothetical protein
MEGGSPSSRMSGTATPPGARASPVGCACSSDLPQRPKIEWQARGVRLASVRCRSQSARERQLSSNQLDRQRRAVADREANVESVYELDSLALENLPRRLVRETDAAFCVRLAEVNGQHWWVHYSEAYSQQSGRASSLVCDAAENTYPRLQPGDR